MKITIISVSEPTHYPQIFRRFAQLGNLTLPVLASLTPPNVTVELIDESVYIKKPDYQKLQTDLAAFSVRTSCANRAYAISDMLRSRGIKTVLGGIHPTALPDESKKHADAVVIGEAETVWHQLIHDFLDDSLEPFYQGDNGLELKNLPIPKRNLIRFPNRAFLSFPTIQAGRGCPHNCSFCSVKKVHGGTYRKRPVEDIVGELNFMRDSKPFYIRPFVHWQDRLLFILDDNLLEDRRYAKKLLKQMQPFKKRWYAQASVNITRDIELLELAREAGCCLLSFGFDSISQKSLDHVNKAFNKTEHYQEAIERVHRFGIMVAASFILGFDDDDTSVFEKTLRFAIESAVDFASFHILTPYPGTQFFDQIIQENRLLVPYGDWSKFDTQHVVFLPKRMNAEELQEGFEWLWREFMTLKSVRIRGRQTANLWFFWPINLFLCGLFMASVMKPKRRDKRVLSS
jgi:radical SAM superfamily enzyme YgiQ (UPF0313 family)